MACETGREKLDAYLDGELAPAEANALSVHMRSCASCATDALGRVQMKRSVAAAGKRYEPSAELRARIAKSVAVAPRRRTGFKWQFAALAAAFAVVAALGLNLYAGRESARRDRIYSELADLHVATLASSTPVDVVSTDRHTVKPWFQGKIPFSFNLPELQGTDFTLLGGRLSYLGQAPGAQLIYQIRKHEISVFIFQDRGAEQVQFPSGATHTLSFNTETWTANGLRYFVVGDVGTEDIQALSKLLQAAG